MPIVSNLLSRLAISIFVPTPSVQATILGFLRFLGIFEIEPKPPILFNFFLPFFLVEILDMNLTNLSAALISTPLFLYVNIFLLISAHYDI